MRSVGLSPSVSISPEGSTKRSRRGWSASHLGAGTATQPGYFMSMSDRRDTLAGTTQPQTAKQVGIELACDLTVRNVDMVTITCPWCAEEAPLAFDELDAPEATFRCPDCGTAVAIVDDAAAAMDLAA